MSDIVNELREPFTFFCEVCTAEPPPKCSDLQLRAAAEIESLRTQLNNCHDEAQARALAIISLRAELAEAKGDTVLLDKLQSNMKKAWPQKTRVAINSSGYFEVSGAKGCYYDLREALAAMQEGK